MASPTGCPYGSPGMGTQAAEKAMTCFLSPAMQHRVFDYEASNRAAIAPEKKVAPDVPKVPPPILDRKSVIAECRLTTSWANDAAHVCADCAGLSGRAERLSRCVTTFSLSPLSALSPAKMRPRRPLRA